MDVYELAAGWIFWSHANQFGAPWSWSQSAAQNWIPEDPTERIWPFYPNASSYCLDTANPLAGDQNIPKFPGYANNVSNVDIALSKPKNETIANSLFSTTISPIISETASSTMTSATSSTPAPPVTSAKSGGKQRTIPIFFLSTAMLGVSTVLAISG